MLCVVTGLLLLTCTVLFQYFDLLFLSHTVWICELSFREASSKKVWQREMGGNKVGNLNTAMHTLMWLYSENECVIESTSPRLYRLQIC